MVALTGSIRSPRPRGNLVRYHGILAPNAKDEDHREDDSNTPTAPMTWMEQLRRVFAIDLSVCPRCRGRLRFIAGAAFGSRLSGADCRMSHDRM